MFRTMFSPIIRSTWLYLHYDIWYDIIHTVKYADYLVLLAKEEKVLQDMIDKLIEIGRCYGMEMNVEKTKAIRISSKIVLRELF